MAKRKSNLGGIVMICYHIIYDITTKHGGQRTYRRRFKDIDKAVDFARNKASEPHVKQVMGFEYDDRGDVVYVYRMAL